MPCSACESFTTPDSRASAPLRAGPSAWGGFGAAISVGRHDGVHTLAVGREDLLVVEDQANPVEQTGKGVSQ